MPAPESVSAKSFAKPYRLRHDTIEYDNTEISLKITYGKSLHLKVCIFLKKHSGYIKDKL